MIKDVLQLFNKEEITSLELPDKFTFPFYYTPHPLARLAAEKLQDYLTNHKDFVHNFGLDANQNGLVIGKMFGVLVVKTKNDELGFLWAYSGKLANENHLKYFVPPIFDMLHADGFFRKEEIILNEINKQIEEIEKSQDFLNVKIGVDKTIIKAKADIENHKLLIKKNKALREIERLNCHVKNDNEFEIISKKLSEASKSEQILLKKMTKFWRYKIEAAQQNLEVFLAQINELKIQRKEKSAWVQHQLFESYNFLNILGESKSIGQIYDNKPPAGAGECAAPKLLHFAFKNQLKPICMAEFWWGQSPKSEVRIHKNYYPACKSKCEPLLLSHMLKGLVVDDNPFQKINEVPKTFKIIFEDDDILAVFKPEEFLSVPGKSQAPSVFSHVKQLYPDATGPLIIHRLDMSTSGIMLLAKNEKAYFHLQQQFIKRTVKKEYVALLDGIIPNQSGIIDLPLRVDLEDRPRQLVCFEHGKTAITHYEVIDTKNNQTKIKFFPHTGRTHQLRVHAAHLLGLNTPIVGDDLYGKKANRLHLHAKTIAFIHPSSLKEMTLTIDEDF